MEQVRVVTQCNDAGYGSGRTRHVVTKIVGTQVSTQRIDSDGREKRLGALARGRVKEWIAQRQDQRTDFPRIKHRGRFKLHGTSRRPAIPPARRDQSCILSSTMCHCAIRFNVSHKGRRKCGVPATTGSALDVFVKFHFTNLHEGHSQLPPAKSLNGGGTGLMKIRFLCVEQFGQIGVPVGALTAFMAPE